MFEIRITSIHYTKLNKIVVMQRLEGWKIFVSANDVKPSVPCLLQYSPLTLPQYFSLPSLWRYPQRREGANLMLKNNITLHGLAIGC
jgi:hypothetical protein